MYQVFNSVEAEPIFKGIKGRKYIYQFFYLTGGIVVAVIFSMISISAWSLIVLISIPFLLKYYERKSSIKKYNFEKKGVNRPKVILIRTSKIYKQLR